MSATVDVLTLGEAMLTLRAPGTLAAGVSLTASVAGAEANAAIGLARLRHQVAWAGRVGDDEAGSLVTRTLRGEGVDTRAVVDTAPTGILLRRERVPGVTTVDYHRRQSAGAAISPEDVVSHLEGETRPQWLHVTGVTPALSDSACNTVVAAVEVARSGGVCVCLDINYRSRLWSAEAARAALTPLARRATVVVASDDELPLVAASPRELLDSGVSLVAIKHGRAGATLHTNEGYVIDQAAVPVRAIDSVGAGDAFCAGLLSGLLDQLDPTESVRRAVLLGAFAVTSSGDWEGLPTRAELGLLTLADGQVFR